jgi:hypothetical protein
VILQDFAGVLASARLKAAEFCYA